MPRLILASASPRRRQLLVQAGYAFEVRSAQVNEDPQPGEDPIAYVLRLAREKAETVFSARGAQELEQETSDRAPGAGITAQTGLVVLGADTTVELDGQILAKPADAEDAARMLRALSGRTHRVITGVAVATGDRTEIAAEVTGVRFLVMSDAEIENYVASGEPMDKAGAYGIQGRAARWIPRVEGCYFNVVGLPLALTATMLEAAGIIPGECVSTSASNRVRSGN